MNDFKRMFSYNAWANERILRVAAGLDPDRAAAAVEGIYGSVTDTARHLLGVEAVYLKMMGGPEIAPPGEADGVALRALAAELGGRYAAFLSALTPQALARRFRVPWFEREFSVSDGLLQVATHSIEHRADLASALTRLGEKTPPIDYIVWAIEQGSGGTKA